MTTVEGGSSIPDSNEDQYPTTNSEDESEYCEEETANSIEEIENAGQMKSRMSNHGALINFIKGNIGTGILSMPIVFKYSGMWLGLLIICASGLLATYCMHLLTSVADDLVLKHTINAFLIITQVGICCVYTLFLTDNILLFVRELLPEDQQVSVDQAKWFYSTAFLVCAFLTPIAIFRSMRMITYLSLLTNICVGIGLLFIYAYIGYVGLLPVAELYHGRTGSKLLVAFSIVAYSVEGIGLVLPIQSKMVDPAAFHSRFGVVNSGMVIITGLFCATGFFGYLAFGEGVEESITLNVHTPPCYFSPIKPLFILGIIGSYIIQFYIPIVIIGRLMEKLSCHHHGSERSRNWHKKLMRASLVWFTFVAAITIPHIDLMISLIGAVASSCLAFVFPPILYTVHFWSRRHNRSCFSLTSVFNIIAFLIGLLAMVGGTITTIIQIIAVSHSSSNSTVNFSR